MVIDAHTHAWGPATREHPWVNGSILDLVDGFDVHTVYTANKLLADMDRNGIDEAVVVGYPICEWTDNEYTLRIVAEHDRLYGIVMLDPFAENAAEQLRTSMAVDGVIGFRLGVACPYDQMWETFDSSVSWLRNAVEKTEFWEAAIESNAVVQILCDHRQLDQALELVEAYPELTYLFDHFCHASPNTPLNTGSFNRLADLAEFESVAVKISEVPHMSNEEFPYEDMHSHVQWLVDVFGRERVIWGSDYPNVSDVATYIEARTWLRQVDSLSATDREWIISKSFQDHI